MKSGFRTKLLEVLGKFGMQADEVRGTTVGSLKINNFLSSKGFRVGNGLSDTNYDFVFLSRKESTLENIINALTKVDNGCIIIFRNTTIRMLNTLSALGTVYLYEYGNNGLIGVLLKGKDKP